MDGLVPNGQQTVCIPKSMRSGVMKLAHENHLGIANETKSSGVRLVTKYEQTVRTDSVNVFNMHPIFL